MNRTQDRLAMFCQCVDQVQNRPSRLAVETRGGFIQEKQELRFGREFDGNGETFSLFNVEPCKY
jgi:hypothetical protein